MQVLLLPKRQAKEARADAAAERKRVQLKATELKALDAAMCVAVLRIGEEASDVRSA
jgi:hypothetical protein